MRYWYLDDFRRGISVFAIFSYGIAVLGTPQCPPLYGILNFSTNSLKKCKLKDKVYVEATNWTQSDLKRTTYL